MIKILSETASAAIAESSENKIKQMIIPATEAIFKCFWKPRLYYRSLWRVLKDTDYVLKLIRDEVLINQASLTEENINDAVIALTDTTTMQRT